MKYSKKTILGSTALTVFFSFFIKSCINLHGNTISNAPVAKDYKESSQRWRYLKNRNQNSYEYTVELSSWIGYHSFTKITVLNGQIIGREFSENSNDLNNLVTVYKEDHLNINTHTEGFKAVTFDEIYQQCLSNYLQVDEKSNQIYFSVDDTNILKSCGYISYDCADDCFVGVNISSFKWI